MAGFTWRDVEGTEGFKSLSYEKKEKLRDDFFMDEIAPMLEQKDLKDAYILFRTKAPIRRDKTLKRTVDRSYAGAQMSLGGGMQAMGTDFEGPQKTQVRDPAGFKIDMTRPIIQNKDGTTSSEKSITVGFDGRYFNIPTIWGGKLISNDEAKARAKKEIKAGEEYPNFDTKDQAVKAAGERSDYLGTLKRGPDNSVGGRVAHDYRSALANDFADGQLSPLEVMRQGFSFLTMPFKTLSESGKALASSTDPGKEAIKFLKEVGEGIVESGAANLEEAQDYGIRRPDSIMREPFLAAEYYGTTVFESFLGNMLPSLMIGRINRRAGLATMGGITMGREYAQERLDGRAHDMALQISFVRGLAEVAFEGPAFNAAFGDGIKFLGKNWKRGGKYAKSAAGRLTLASVLEGISEDFTEITNILYDRYGLGKEWPPEVAAQLKDAFVSGVLMGAPMTATTLTLEYMDSTKKQQLADDFNKLIAEYGYPKQGPEGLEYNTKLIPGPVNLHGKELPKPPIYVAPGGEQVDLLGGSTAETGFRAAINKPGDPMAIAGSTEDVGRRVSSRGEEQPIPKQQEAGTGLPGNRPLPKDTMYGIQPAPLFPQDDPGLMQELPQDQLGEEQPAGMEPDPGQGELVLPDQPEREGWTDNPDAEVGEPVAFLGSPEAHNGYVIEQPEADGSVTYEAFDEDGDFINPAETIEEALDLVERAAGIAEIQGEDAEFEDEGMEDVIQGITDIFGADELPEEKPAETAKVEPKEVIEDPFTPEPGNIDDAYIDYQLSYYDARTDQETKALNKKYEKEFGEDAWFGQLEKADEGKEYGENTKYDQHYSDRVDAEIRKLHARQDRLNKRWKEGAPEGLLPGIEFNKKRLGAIVSEFLRADPDSRLDMEELSLLPGIYVGAGISKEGAKTIWKNLIGKRTNRAIDVYRKLLGDPDSLTEKGKVSAEAFLKAMRVDYQSWAKGWKRRKNVSEAGTEVTIPDTARQPTQIGDGFYWLQKTSALGFARVYGFNNKPVFQLVFRGVKGWTFRWKNDTKSKDWLNIGPDMDIQEIDDESARNEEGDSRGQDQVGEGETPLSEEARDEAADELGDDRAGDVEDGVEPQSSDDQDLTESETPETQAEGEGEETPLVEEPAPAEYEALTEYKVKEVVGLLEAVRKMFAPKTVDGVTLQSQQTAEEHLHQAIGNLIEGKLDSALLRVELAHTDIKGSEYKTEAAALQNAIDIINTKIGQETPPAETPPPVETAAEEKPEHTQKMEDEGLDLKRYWDKLKAEIEAAKSDGTKTWDLLNKTTQRAKLFNPKPHPEASPGTQRYLDAFQASLKTYSEILKAIANIDRGPILGGRLDSASWRGMTFGELVAERIDQSNVAIRATLADIAREYALHMNELSEALSGTKSITETEAIIAEWYDTTKRLSWNNLILRRVGAGGPLGKDVPKMPYGGGNEAEVTALPATVDKSWAKLWPLLNQRSMEDGKAPVPSRSLAIMLEHEAEAIDPNKKKSLQRPRMGEITREGKEVRDGDVTTEQFKEEFGFGDGKIFGDWVTAPEQRKHLNASWDSFADLAEFLGIPRKAIGFYGKLYFTIGALGHGKAAAHFQRSHPTEIGRVPVINVTKTNGDGSLAHEWGHAFDYFVFGMGEYKPAEQEKGARMARLKLLHILKWEQGLAVLERSLRKSMIDGWAYSRTGYARRSLGAVNYFVREEWSRQASNTDERAYRTADKYAKVNTFYRDQANKLGKGYWGNDQELIARSWESWIYDAMEGSNIYLVDDWVADGKLGPEAGYKGSPYPIEEERALFNGVYEALRKAIVVKDEAVTIDLKKFLDNLPEEVRDLQGKAEKFFDDIPRRYQEQQDKEFAEKTRIAKERREQKEKAEEEQWAAAQAEAEAELRLEAEARELEEAAKKEQAETDPAGAIDPNRPMTMEEIEALVEQAENMSEEELREPGPDGITDKTRTASDIAGEIKKNIGGGMKDIVKGINEILKPGGGVGMMGAQIFDPERYEKLKPYFRSGLNQMRAAGKGFIELTIYFKEQFSQNNTWELVKPYFMRWAHDEGLGANLSSEPQENEPQVPDPQSLAGFVIKNADKIKNNHDLKVELQTFLNRKPTEIEIKLGQEALETAFYHRARHIFLQYQGRVLSRKEAFDQLVTAYNNQPILSSRTSTSMENQAYSTPMPLAYMTSLLAGIDSGTTVYEPTAGNGALLIGASHSRVAANEIDPNRAKALRDLGFKTATEHDAEIWQPETFYDAVIANPPFGKSQHGNQRFDGFIVSARDHIIAAKALERMKDGGKAVLIMGAPKEESTIIKGAKRIFYNWLYSRYNVVDHVEVSGKLYSRSGASWPVVVITIHGRKLSETFYDNQPVKRLNTWEEVYEHGNALLDPERDARTPTDSELDTGSATTEPGGASGEAGGTTDAAGESTGVGGRTGGGAIAGTDIDTGEQLSGSAADGVVGSRGSDSGDRSGASQTDDTGQQGESLAPVDVQDINLSGQDTSAGDSALSGELQTAYKAGSKSPGQQALVPVNMRDALEKALLKLKAEVGDLDAYVLRKLKYKNKEEFFKSFMGLQVDAIAAAIWNHENKDRAIIIADQTGLGKGRQGAAMIRYALRNGYTPVFMTAKANLFTDMYDDLLDIGMKEHEIAPFIFNHQEGWIVDRSADDVESLKARIYRHNSTEMRKGREALSIGKMPLITNKQGKLVKSQIVMATYTQINIRGWQRPLIMDIVEQMKPFFVLDEAHEISGDLTKSEKNTEGVWEVVDKGAGFMFRAIAESPTTYMSATWAKTANNTPIYRRTDLIDAVEEASQLATVMSRGGEALSQWVSSMLAQSGQLWRRERSYDGIKFHTTQYKQDPKNPARFFVEDSDGKIVRDLITSNTLPLKELQDRTTEGLRTIVDVDRSFSAFIKENTGQWAGILGGLGAVLGPNIGLNEHTHVASSPFTSVVHNFIKQLLLSMKADIVVQEAIRLHKAGEQVVVVVENTMERFLKAQIEAGVTDFGKPWKGDYRTILQAALTNTRRVTVEDAEGNRQRITIPMELLKIHAPHVHTMYENAAEDINSLPVKEVIMFPIDYIRGKLEKAGMVVGEVTGRHRRVNYNTEDGVPVVERRPKSETASRRTLVDRFNKDEYDVLIGNSAMATGLSIHASEQWKERYGITPRKRHMLVGQAMGNINTLMQVFGRINRTGQVETAEMMPEYSNIYLDLPAEIRPMSMTERKMRGLNASTSSNVKGANSLDVSALFNHYGDFVVNEFLGDNPELANLTGYHWQDTPMPDVATKFTGKLSLATYEQQLSAYSQIMVMYEEYISEKKQTGEYDLDAEFIDLDAKIIENKVLYTGKDTDKLLGGDAIIHAISAKNTGKPPTGAKVIKAMMDNRGGKTSIAITREVVQQAEDLDTFTQNLDKQIEDLLKEQVNWKGKDPAPEDKEGVKEKKEELAHIKGRLVTLRERKRVRTTETIPTIRQMVLKYRIGKVYQISIADENMLGVITNIRHRGTDGKEWSDSWAKGKFVIQFAVNTPMGFITRPLTRVEMEGFIVRDVSGHNQYEGPEGIKRIFDTNRDKFEGREERYVVTGNPIGGMSSPSLPLSVKVVNFRAVNGRRYTGLLLPRNFGQAEWDAIDEQPVVLRSSAEISGYLNVLAGEDLHDISLASIGIYNADQSVRLYYDRWENEFIIRAKIARKAPQDKVKFDPELKRIVGDFAGRGKYMTAIFQPHKIAAVAQRLAEITTMNAPASAKDLIPGAVASTEARKTRYAFDELGEDMSLKSEGVVSDTTLDNEKKAQQTEQTIDEVPDDAPAFKLADAFRKSLLFSPTRWPRQKSAGIVNHDAVYITGVLNQREGNNFKQGDVRVVTPPASIKAQVQALERIFGKKVVFWSVNRKGGVSGFATPRAATKLYININTVMSLATLTGHELWHSIEFENPELAKELWAAIANSTYALEFIRAKTEAFGDDWAKDPISELMADIVGDILTNPRLLYSLDVNTPNTLKKLLLHIKEWLARLIGDLGGRYQGNKSKQYIDDLETVQAAVKEILTKHLANISENVLPLDPATADVPSFMREEIRSVMNNVWTKNVEGFYDKQALRFSGWYSPLGNLPQMQEYLRKRYLALGKLGEIDILAKQINEAFEPKIEGFLKKAVQYQGDAKQKAWVKETKKQVYEYLIDPDANASSIKYPKARKNAIKVKKMLDGMGQKLVDAGLLSEEAYLEHKDGYLPQLYLKYLLKPGVYSDLGLHSGVSSMDWRKKRILNNPEDADQRELRRVILGEVKDPGFLASVSIGRTMRDMALLDFMEEVAQQEDAAGQTAWIHPDSIAEWQGHTVSIFWLEAEANRLTTQARHTEDAQDKADMRELSDQMMKMVEDRKNLVGLDTENYRQMPNTPQFGRLRGLWVRKEIHSDLVGIHFGKGLRAKDVGSTAAGLESWFSVGGYGTKMTQWWKILKVPLNPPTQFRNFVSNMVLLNLSGIPMHQVLPLYTEALGQVRANGQYYRIAMKYGVSKSTFASNELAALHTDLIKISKEASDDGFKHMGQAALLAASHFVEKAGNVYQMMETIGKTAKIMYEMRVNGLSEAKAALEAHKTLFDYSLIPNTVRWFRNSPFGMPFITFQYKVLPNLLETAIKYPWRLAPYIALPMAMSVLLQELFDVDDDDLEKLKKAFPEWMHNKSHVYLLPYMTEDGRWDAFDFSFFLPWSMYTETGTSIAQGEWHDIFTETGLFGGPLAQALSAWNTGIDPFTGREIWKKGDPLLWQAADLMLYTWSLAAPSWLTKTGAVGKWWQAAGLGRYAAIDAQGRAKIPWWHVPAKFFGLNLYRIDPAMTRAQNLRRMKFEIAERKRVARRDIGQPGLSEKQVARRLLDHQKIIDERIEQMLEYADESEVHPNLRQ